MENQVENQRKNYQQQMNFKIKKILWNLLLILIAGCLLVAAIEGVGLREKYPFYSNGEIIYYNLEVLTLTKLSVLNDLYNHLLAIGQLNDLDNKTLVLAHDTYGLFVAGISIIFLSTLIPLLSLLNQKSMSKLDFITGGRIISGIGWLLTLTGSIVFVAKTVTNINDFTGSNEQAYRSFSEIFDSGAIAGLFILMGIAGVPLLVPKSWKSWVLNYQTNPNQTEQQFTS